MTTKIALLATSNILLLWLFASTAHAHDLLLVWVLVLEVELKLSIHVSSTTLEAVTGCFLLNSCGNKYKSCCKNKTRFPFYNDLFQRKKTRKKINVFAAVYMENNTWIYRAELRNLFRVLTRISFQASHVLFYLLYKKNIAPLPPKLPPK